MTETTTIGRRTQDLVAAVRRDDSGATVIEYALIASLMAVMCIAAFSSLGFDVGETWRHVANKVSDAMTR